MPKLAVRFLVLSMLTTSLLVMPIVTQADAATTSHKHIKKRARVVHQSPKLADPGANPFASKYENDFDRKNAGGGGGY
jgi:hypothetical protein